MTVQEGTDRVAGSHGQSTAGFIIKMIREAEVDEYLKAIFDAVKDRKSELEYIGGLPGQKTVSQASIDITQDQQYSAPQHPATNSKPRVSKGGKRFYAHKPRPAADMQVFSGTVQPLRDASGIDPNAMFGYGGLMYQKSDVVGHCFRSEFEGHSLRFQVIGVGPKAVKILLVDEPPTHIQHNGKSLHAAWQSNEPIFIGHAALAPWLHRGI